MNSCGKRYIDKARCDGYRRLYQNDVEDCLGELADSLDHFEEYLQNKQNNAEQRKLLRRYLKRFAALYYSARRTWKETSDIYDLSDTDKLIHVMSSKGVAKLQTLVDTWQFKKI